MYSSSIEFAIKESPKKVKIKVESPKKSPSKHDKKEYQSDTGSVKITVKKEDKVDLKHAVKSLVTLKRFFLKIVQAIKSALCTCNSIEATNNELITK